MHTLNPVGRFMNRPRGIRKGSLQNQTKTDTPLWRNPWRGVCFVFVKIYSKAQDFLPEINPLFSF